MLDSVQDSDTGGNRDQAAITISSNSKAKELNRDQIERLRLVYAAKPDLWIERVFNETLWYRQKEIARAVARYPRVAIRSANASGKSFIMARLALHWLSIYSPSLVVTTAPSSNQVKEIIWAELRRAYMKALRNGVNLGSDPLTQKWQPDINRLAIGFSPREYDPSASQGLHSQNTLVIIDEACGVDENVFNGVVAMTRGAVRGHIVAISNPLTTGGWFYDACTKNVNWYKMKISAWESPNVRSGQVIIPGLISRKDIDDLEADFGRDSWNWRVFIEAEFPSKDDDALIAIDWVAQASNREPSPNDLKAEVEVGADIARQGSDRTVFVARRGNFGFAMEQHEKKDLMTVTGLLKLFCETYNAKTVRIDTAGLGAGVTDRMREICGNKTRVIEMIGPSKATNYMKYTNAVTEWWDRIANLLKSGQASGPIFANRFVQSDLVGRKYRILSNGLITLDSKIDTKKKIHRSPDFGDAIALAFAGGIEGSARRAMKSTWGRD